MARPPRIDRDAVVAAAIEVLDEEGLTGLSLERIAQRLDVRAPSLYHHYADKAEILTDVARTILGDLRVDVGSATDWRELLVQFCLAFYRRVIDHPNAVVLLIEHLPPSSVLGGFERSAAALAEAGIPVEHQAAILEGTQHFLWGLVLYRSVRLVNRAFVGPLDDDRYPHWSGAVGARALRDEELLEVGVRALVDGMTRHLEANGAPHTIPPE